LSADDKLAIQSHINDLPRPLISIVMPAYETPESYLRAAIASVRSQLYQNWELCVTDDASPSPHVARLLGEAAAADPRIRWSKSETNGNICVATNEALAMATGEWVVLMDHDDELRPHALYELVVEIAAHPDAQIVYSDEDHIDEHGRRSNPYFKSDFDPDLLLGQNLVSHLGAYRRDLLMRLGGVRKNFEGSQDHDLALRAVQMAGASAVRHIPTVLYHWRHVADMTSFSQTSIDRCVAASRRAVQQHLSGVGQKAEVLPAPLTPMFHRVKRSLPDPAPLVSVIIPTHDRAHLLRECLDGLLHGTDYPALEVIIVDHESREPETAALFTKLAEEKRVRILQSTNPFNYSRLINRAAAQAKGEVLLLLNDDIKVTEPLWLSELVTHAIRPEIGAVGCKLLFRTGGVQHGGIVLGVRGIAGHFLTNANRTEGGPLGSLALVRTVSAVTSACLAVRREVFDQVAGLDEENLAMALNDIDFCLRLRELGYRNLWTPFAELVRLEPASTRDEMTQEESERFKRETRYLKSRWGDELIRDPYWNPNLSLDNAMRVLADSPRRSPSWMTRAK
jgi:glycosyltransferase involved in cell wall biosynthesis